MYEGVRTELGIPTSFCCCYSCRSAGDALWTLSHPLPHSSFPTPPTPLFPPTSPLTLPSHFPLTSPLSTHQTCLLPLPLLIPHPHQQTQVESHWVSKFRVCLMDSIFLHTVFSYLAMYINHLAKAPSFLPLPTPLPGLGVIVGPVLGAVLLIIVVVVTVIIVTPIVVHYKKNRVAPVNV